MGALSGAVVAAIGGLLAVGMVPAILEGDIAELFATPILSVLAWIVCWPVGWLLGGQIGPRIGERTYSRRAEVVAGSISGLLPVIAVAVWSYYMSTH